jgi:hypothetical protein
MQIFQNRHDVKRNRRIDLLGPAFQPEPFVTATSRSRNWSDSEKFSPFGRADLAASAALRAIRCTIYSFMARRLATAATSTRAMSGIVTLEIRQNRNDAVDDFTDSLSQLRIYLVRCRLQMLAQVARLITRILNGRQAIH